MRIFKNCEILLKCVCVFTILFKSLDLLANYLLRWFCMSLKELWEKEFEKKKQILVERSNVRRVRSVGQNVFQSMQRVCFWHQNIRVAWRRHGGRQCHLFDNSRRFLAITAYSSSSCKQYFDLLKSMFWFCRSSS